ncbi:methyltransferase domain-containing protein [Candidatus Wolfebacteria bacterium]|nr:methyltransferase domain-containing protein [Candidatus Wolfebacteria bacterium]
MGKRFDLIASSYEKALKLYPEARTDVEEILELLNIRGNETILETTCGTGYLTEKIARLLKSGRLIAHDVSSAMLSFAELKIKDAGFKNVDIRRADDIFSLQLEDCSIDKFVCFGGFHHLEEPVRMFKTASRLLKIGGILVVGDFADNSLVQKYFDEKVHYLSDGGHSGLFLSESQMLNFGRFADLEVISIERKRVPFIFSSIKDIGFFYQLVHFLNQNPEETADDIGQYMGVIEESGKFIVPMDYIYAKYQKVAGF